MYNTDTANIVGDWYKEDIDYFGYDFGTGPSKNYWRLDNE
jgi:hypothetical protein